MNDALEQWLGESIGALEMLEREVNDHHRVIQQAMAVIRHREGVIERLERNMAVIRRATNEVDTFVEEHKFEQDFDRAFAPEYSYEEVEAADSLEYFRVEAEDSNVVHVRPTHSQEHSGVQLPPPPPGLRARAGR